MVLICCDRARAAHAPYNDTYESIAEQDKTKPLRSQAKGEDACPALWYSNFKI